MESQHKPPRSRLSFRKVFLIAGIVSLLLLYPVLWLRVMTDPAQRTAADFLPFYAAGRIALTQGLSMVYDWESQRQAENDILDETIRQILVSRGQPLNPQNSSPPIQASEVNPFPHPPFIVPLLMLLALLNYLPAFVVWSVLMSIIFLICAIMLVRLVPQIQGQDRWALFLATVLFFPAFYSVLNGQDTALLLLGASLWVYGLFQEHDSLSGIGLALTLIRPHMVVMLALPFMFKRRKVWWAFCAGAGVLVLISALLLGRIGMENYLRILVTSANGEGNKFFNENLMVNLIGLLQRTFPAIQSSSIRLVGWIGFAAALVYLCVVWAKSAGIKEKQVALAVLTTIFFVPHIHYHDLALLLIPIFGIMRIMLNKKILKTRDAVLLPLGVSILLFASFLLLPALKYIVLYLLMIMILVATMIYL